MADSYISGAIRAYAHPSGFCDPDQETETPSCLEWALCASTNYGPGLIRTQGLEAASHQECDRIMGSTCHMR